MSLSFLKDFFLRKKTLILPHETSNFDYFEKIEQKNHLKRILHKIGHA